MTGPETPRDPAERGRGGRGHSERERRSETEPERHGAERSQDGHTEMGTDRRKRARAKGAGRRPGVGVGWGGGQRFGAPKLVSYLRKSSDYMMALVVFRSHCAWGYNCDSNCDNVRSPNGIAFAPSGNPAR